MPDCSHCKGAISTPRCQKPPCGHCAETLACPPPISFLLQNFPDITPNYPLDRNQRRCRHCDLIATHKKVIDAENPPPTYVNRVKIIRSHVERAERTFSDGNRKDDLEPSLPGLRKALSEAVEKRDRRAEEAWREYWGIWGRGKTEEVVEVERKGTYYPRFVHMYPPIQAPEK